ncbi:MAG: hypothetical protein AAF804_16855 [Bacteroidota bacterium]
MTAISHGGHRLLARISGSYPTVPPLKLMPMLSLKVGSGQAGSFMDAKECYGQATNNHLVLKVFSVEVTNP